MRLTADDWFIDAEMVIQSRRLKFKTGEIPTTFYKCGYRKSYVNFYAVLNFKNLFVARIRESFPMNEQNIFITGITGKIGRALIPRLDFSHYDIYALCRNTDYHFNQPLKIIKGNLSEPESYSTVFHHNIHTVVHLGAVTHTGDPAEYYRINEEATRKLIRLCEDHKINRFVFISTRSISDNGGNYSRSKLLAETHTINSSIDWVIIRLSEIYGISENEGVDFILNRIKKCLLFPSLGMENTPSRRYTYRTPFQQ